jgi:hypothetical protein
MTVTPKTRALVIARDNSICAWCGLYVDTTTGWYSLQHRRARGMGGSRLPDTDQPQNLVLVHGTGTTLCHGEIESKRAEAVRRGFNVQQGNDPTVVPLLVHSGPAGFWVRLDAEGGREQIHPADEVEYMQLIGAQRVGVS